MTKDTITSQKYFEVSFTKNDNVHPDTVKPSDIADILKAIENIVETQVYKQHPEISKEQVIIGFTHIKSSSIDPQFNSVFPDIIYSAILDVGQAINSNDYSRLPLNSYKDLKTLVNYTRKLKCVVELAFQNGKRSVIATLSPDIKIERPCALTGETTVYAKIIRVGGKEPKVEIDTIDGRTLYCNAPFEITTKLGAKLYQIVGLIGVAEWDNDLNNIEQFSITGIIEYEKAPIKEAMSKLAEATQNYYAGIDNVEQYVSEIRGSGQNK